MLRLANRRGALPPTLARFAPVNLALESGGRVEIKSGLKPEEIVVTQGAAARGNQNMMKKLQYLTTKGLKSKVSILTGAGALVLASAALGATLFVASPQNQALARQSQPLGKAPKNSAIDWQPSYEAALSQAKTSGKPVMIDFGAAWCGACKMMDEQTYPHPAVVAESKNFVMVKVDVDARNDLAARYGISSLPTTVWLRPNGKAVVGTIGALDARDLIAAMREASRRIKKSRNQKTT